ncbi:MAG TPA: hypothetical protein VK789_06900 [Bryobacteraceae bacterium]|jgi:hypothetical protein|nr:hypothetical protein [Bryobacteraceae bacterium]
MQYVTIPFGFDGLSSEEQAAVVPICIQRTDRHGNQIEWGWFEAVSDVQESLRRLARSWLEDVWRVSELAEASVHTLWYRHGANLGYSPAGRVLVQARWHAKDFRAGSWQRRRGVVLGLEGLDELLRSRVLTDPTEYENLYQKEMYFKDLSQHLEDAGQAEVSRMLTLIRDGRRWSEVGEELAKDPDAARMRFRRWISRFLHSSLKSSARSPV